MKKFSFSLQRVLSAREAERQRIEIRLGEKLAELERVRAERRSTTEQIARQVQEIEQGSCMGTARQMYTRRLDYLEGLQQHLLRQARVMVRIEREADGIRQELYRMMRNCKILEKIRDNELAAWKNKVLREEQALIDEVAGVATHTRRMEGALATWH